MIDQSKCLRVMPQNIKNTKSYLIYLRHLFAYECAVKYMNSDSSVIEIGFGEGYGAKYIEDHCSSYSGFDISEEMTQHAQSKYGSSSLTFDSFDGTRLPVDDSQYDVAISFQVIEHVSNVNAYLNEIRRVIKPGGWALLTTPNRKYRLYKNQKPWNKFHLREYDVSGLSKELSGVFQNYQVLGIKGIGETHRFELERADKARRLHRLDPLGLRNYLPKTGLFSSAGAADVDEKASNLGDKYSLQDYQVVEVNLEDSLDHFAVCKK